MIRGLSSFDILVIVAELQELTGSYIEKIYQISRDEILIKVQQKQGGKKETLYIRNGELFCRTGRAFDTPEKPSVFAMTLRKYLLNGTISSITQHEFDRVIKLQIGRKEGEYTVVCELFTNGNIILLDPEGRIIRPLLSQEWAHRIIKTGQMYVPPPVQTNPFLLSESEFITLLASSKKELVRTLATTINLSGLYAEELCVRAGVDKHRIAGDLDSSEVFRLYTELQGLLKAFREKNFQPVSITKDDGTVDVLPFPFIMYSSQASEAVKGFTQGLERYIDARKEARPVKDALQKKKEKLQRQLAQQQELITEFSATSKEKKTLGDLLYVHFSSLESLLSEITEVLKHKEKEEGIAKIQSNSLVKQFDPTANELVVTLLDQNGNPVDVSLDFRKSIAENAAVMYEESKKLLEKIKGAQEAVSQTKDQLQTVQHTVAVESKRTVTHEKQWWFEHFRWFISSEGNVIVAGRDAKSNDAVVKKYLTEGDRYVHADIHGAPSCIVKSKGVHDEPLPISEQTLQESCEFGAAYSRAWNQFAEAQAYWVLPEQVSKTPQSGEYVPKGGFIIRGKRNYQRCSLQVAVGLITIGETKKLMGGPVSSVAAHTNHYVVLVPGTTKKSALAKTLSKTFHVSTDAVEKVLPPGNAMIQKTEGIDLA